MKKYLITLLCGVLLGAAAVWYFLKGRENPTVQRAQQSVADTTGRMVDSFKAKLDAYHLNSDEINDELTRTGKVVRRQASDFGSAVADATSDTRITAAVKAKFALDRDLSAWSISVSTTDGRVTLAGNVSTHEQIGKAMLLALETDGVREVNSTLQVKSQT